MAPEPARAPSGTRTDGSLTVVVANSIERPGLVMAALDALHQQIDPRRGDRVVWTTRTDLVPRHPLPLTVVAGTASDGRGELYGHGFGKVTTDLVAFVDSTTVVEPGWRDAIDHAWRTGESFVGGPVRPGQRRSRTDWAGFLVEYGVHAVAPYTTTTGAVSANNMMFSVGVLEPWRGRPLWKTVVAGDLARVGVTPSVTPGMAVTATKHYDRAWLLGERFDQGWLYGTQARTEVDLRRHALRALAAGALPPVLFARLARTVGFTPGLRRRLVTAAPLILLALAAWSAGEAKGYLVGGAPPGKVF